MTHVEGNKGGHPGVTDSFGGSDVLGVRPATSAEAGRLAWGELDVDLLSSQPPESWGWTHNDRRREAEDIARVEAQIQEELGQTPPADDRVEFETSATPTRRNTTRQLIERLVTVVGSKYDVRGRRKIRDEEIDVISSPGGRPVREKGKETPRPDGKTRRAADAAWMAANPGADEPGMLTEGRKSMKRLHRPDGRLGLRERLFGTASNAVNRASGKVEVFRDRGPKPVRSERAHLAEDSEPSNVRDLIALANTRYLHQSGAATEAEVEAHLNGQPTPDDADYSDETLQAEIEAARLSELGWGNVTTLSDSPTPEEREQEERDSWDWLEALEQR